MSGTDLDRFLEEFPSIIAGSSVVTMSGSAPRGVPADIYRKLTAAAKKEGAKVILDTSGSYLSEGLSGCPDMIKPNGDEIESLLGIRVGGYEDVLRAARDLREKYQIPWVVISLGKDGAVLACEAGIWHAKPPELAVVNTVGCGDSMVGAFAVAMEQKKAAQEALRYAVAVSAASAMSPFTGHYDPAVVEKIRADVTREKC